MRGDEPRVRQVVTNLLANAVKFTASGHVSVRTEWVSMPDGRAAVSVQVDDSGPGIAAERREAVFDAFVQADPSLTRSHGGAGLGLAIARRATPADARPDLVIIYLTKPILLEALRAVLARYLQLPA